jgi:hypothetical protein
LAPSATASPDHWKEWVTALRAACLRRRKSARPTSGSGCSSSPDDNWPTPNANVSNYGESLETWAARRQALKDKGYNGNGCGTPLAIAALQWATPLVKDATRGDDSTATREGSPSLAGQVNRFSHPAPAAGSSPGVLTAESYESLKTTMHSNGVGCLEVADGIWPPHYPSNPSYHPDVWPTPTAERATGYLSGSYRDTWRPTLDGLAEGAAPEFKSTQKKRPALGLKLNPRFTEWLMGWPVGWTDFAPAATAWCRYRPRMRTALSQTC